MSFRRNTAWSLIFCRTLKVKYCWGNNIRKRTLAAFKWIVQSFDKVSYNRRRKDKSKAIKQHTFLQPMFSYIRGHSRTMKGNATCYGRGFFVCLFVCLFFSYPSFLHPRWFCDNEKHPRWKNVFAFLWVSFLNPRVFLIGTSEKAESVCNKLPSRTKHAAKTSKHKKGEEGG